MVVLMTSRYYDLVIQLTARPDRVLAMHSELRDAHLYLDFIAFGFLVCPSLLFQPESKYMEIFRVCVTDQLVVTLYRELVSYVVIFLSHIFIHES